MTNAKNHPHDPPFLLVPSDLHLSDAITPFPSAFWPNRQCLFSNHVPNSRDRPSLVEMLVSWCCCSGIPAKPFAAIASVFLAVGSQVSLCLSKHCLKSSSVTYVQPCFEAVCLAVRSWFSCPRSLGTSILLFVSQGIPLLFVAFCSFCAKMLFLLL